MNNRNNIVGIAILILLAFVLSYVGTIFIYWLITLCFGLTWTLANATGIWLIMLLISMVTGSSGIKLNHNN